jgi:homoserine acetyltransferase
MPPKDPYDGTGIEYYSIPNFKFSSGVTHDIKVAYRSFNPSSTKGTVLIPTCYGGRINTTLNFTTGCLSTYNVIVVAMLGNGESTSPSNDPSFPPDYSLRYQDCISSQYALLTSHLGIKSLEAVIGFSMGGQQAYYWAVMHGSGPSPYVKNSVVICGSAKTSGHNYAFLEGPIAALTVSRDYDGGKYKANGIWPNEGLRAFGRAYAAWLTSPEWFRQELWREIGAESLKAWLHPAAGKASFESWDAEDLLVLARMWQAGNVGDVGGEGDYRKGLEGVSARVLVMPSQTDQYFPPEDGEEEVKYLRNGVFDPIPTIWGHIAGGGANQVDAKWMDERIEKFLREGK